MAKVPHLLLTSMGRSPCAVFALLAQLDAKYPVSHLWVLTTSDNEIVERLDDYFERPFRKDIGFLGIEYTVFVAKDVTDIRSDEDHRNVSEILFRLALRGVDWARDQKGRFSIGIVGGRKTMSASLQQAAVFFPANGVYHIDYEGDEDDINSVEVVRGHLEQHYLIPIAGEPSPWHEVLLELWGHQFRHVGLVSETFGLDEQPCGNVVEVCPADSSGWLPYPELKSLPGALAGVANRIARFARPRTIAASLSGQFLRHDLRDLLGNLEDKPEFLALNSYLKGLRELVEEDLPQGTLYWRELPGVLHHALILAVGRYVQNLHAEGSLSVTPSIESDLAERRTSNFSRDLLLVILRNLLANVRKHGRDPNVDEPTAVVHSRLDSNAFLILEVRNRVSVEKANALRHLGPSSLLLPDVKHESDGDGIGLFAIDEVTRRCEFASPVILIEGDEFVVRLQFPI